MAKGVKTGGRVAGTPNKATQAAREAIAAFVDGNAHRLQDWLDQIAEEKGALDAFRAFTDLLEYHVPKLARTELTGKDGAPIETRNTIDAAQLTTEQLKALAGIQIPEA